MYRHIPLGFSMNSAVSQSVIISDSGEVRRERSLTSLPRIVSLYMQVMQQCCNKRRSGRSSSNFSRTATMITEWL